MTNSQNRLKFLASEEANVMRQDLLAMAKDPHFNTKSVYTTSDLPETTLFIEKHMTYMSNNLSITPEQYLSNLRLRTRIRN